MKRILSTLLSIFILSSGLFLLACDNKSSGVLIPQPAAGDIQVSDTNAKNDTARISADGLIISVFGGWTYDFTPPPNGKNERTSFDFTYTIENKGKSDLVIDVKKSAILSNRLERSRQLSVTELIDSKDRGMTALSKISSDTVKIKAGERKIYVDYFAASLKDENSIAGDEIVYKLPAGLSEGRDLTIKFKCVSSGDIEFIRRGPQRPQISPSN